MRSTVLRSSTYKRSALSGLHMANALYVINLLSLILLVGQHIMELEAQSISQSLRQHVEMQ